MTTRLRNLRIGKVALCFRGANQQAEVLLYKSAPARKDDYAMGDDDAPPLDYAQRGQQAAMRQEFRDKWSRFCETVWEIMDDDADDAVYAPILLRSIEQFRADVGDLLTSLGLVEKAKPFFAVCTEVTKAGAIMAAGRKQRLRDAIAALQAILDEAEPQPAETTKGAARMAEQIVEGGTVAMATFREVEKRADTAEARVTSLEAELVAKSLTAEEQEAAYLKTLPEAVRKKYEADQVEKAALREELRVEKDARQRQEYIEKTAAYRQVGLTPDHHNVLKAIDAMPEQERTELLRILKSVSEVIKAGSVFTTYGKDGGAPAGGAGERIAKMATDRAAASDGTLTYHQAYAAVLDEQPALYQEYRAEQKGRA